jgi:serine protease AprX
MMALSLAVVLASAGWAVGAPQKADPRFTLDLGGARFDPLVETPAFPSDLAHLPRGPVHDLHLVQFEGPIKGGQLEAIQRHGLEVVQYIHPWTYVVWSHTDALTPVRDEAGVRCTIPFAPACRLLPIHRSRNEAMLDVRMLVVRAAGPASVVRRMHELGVPAVNRRVVDKTFEVFSCTVGGDRLAALASIPGVYTVQPVPMDGGTRAEVADQVNADNFEGNGLYPGYYEWLTELGITGDGVTLASVDTGICIEHPDLTSRVTDCDGESCNDGKCTGHGTRVAGVLVGDGASGVNDPWGFRAGLGLAPRSMLVDQLFSPVYEEPDGMLRLMRTSRLNGAVLSNNSWGPSATALGYDLDTRLVDVGVRDADGEAYGNQPLGYVLSIMNGSGGSQSQGTPDEALNIISVGATKLRTAGGVLQSNYDDIASVSAHGPCLDGRLLPDLVAPGCFILSPSGSASWDYTCGTSMAAPQVAGALGLFTDYYKSSVSLGRDPSPAMSKAAVLLSARDLFSNEDADGVPLGHVPDSKQGWGRLQLPELINPDVGTMRYVDQSIVFDETDETWSVNVVPHDVSKPMRIMLVWTTAPGHGLGGTTPAWTNDLDLVVEADGQTYAANTFSLMTGYSMPGGQADGMNNTEAVFLGPHAPSAAQITVVASNIVADGIPAYGDGTDQDFALVCWNCEADPFTLEINPPWQDGCSPGTMSAEVIVNETGSGSGPVQLQVIGDSELNFMIEDVVVTPPATTTIHMTLPLGMAGTFDYSVQAVSAEFTQTVDATLVVESNVALAPVLELPVEGEADVSTLPTLSWEDTPGASAYSVEIAETSDFATPFYWASESTTSHAVIRSLGFGRTYYWRVRSINACGEGDWSDVSSFTTSEGVVVLFVDDDDNTPDIRPYYTDVFDDLGLTYDVWDTENSNFEPDLMTLGAYDLVVWASGHEWGGSAGPGPEGEAALSAWLDTGGTLLLSSQDYLYDQGLTGFGANYLGVSDYESDEGQSVVAGVTAPFDGISTTTLSHPFSDYSDVLELSAAGAVAFDGDNGIAGALVDQGTWRTAFLAFPVEAMPEPEDRRSLLLAAVNWVPQPPSCPADITGDGTVSVEDLLVVLSNWGGSGAADINEDGIVDVMDLLGVVAEWGVCP